MLNEYNAASSAALKADMIAQLGSALIGISQLQANGAVPRDQSVDDYAVNDIYEKFALGGSPFTIYNFSTRSGEIGSSEAGCGNCK